MPWKVATVMSPNRCYVSLQSIHRGGAGGRPNATRLPHAAVLGIVGACQRLVLPW